MFGRLRPQRERGASRTAAALAAAVLGALLLIVVAAGLRGQRGGRGTAAGSSFRADESGALGARLLLEGLGLDVASRRGARLPRGTGHVLVRVEGLPKLTLAERPEEELQAEGLDLSAWVERGNAVLLFGAETPAKTAWPEIVPRLDPVAGAGMTIGPVMPIGAAGTLGELFGVDRPAVPELGRAAEEHHEFPELDDPWITPGWRVEHTPHDVVLCATDEDGDTALIVERTRGTGRVVAVADPYFVSNVRLADSDNAAWLATLVERVRGEGRVWFDDRAVGQAASRGVLSLLVEWGLGPALAAGLVLLLLAWWRAGPSDAPERRVREQRAYAPESFALLRAELYEKCLNEDEIRRMVRDEVSRRLARGESLSFERALDLLAVRDPARADTLRAAIGRLPRHKRATFRLAPGTWCRAVAGIWRALDEARPRTHRHESATRSPDEEAHV